MCDIEQAAYDLALIDEAIAAADWAIAQADATIKYNAYQSKVTARMAAFYALYACQSSSGMHAPCNCGSIGGPEYFDVQVAAAIESKKVQFKILEGLHAKRQKVERRLADLKKAAEGNAE